jgi:hypothetical protein
MSVNAAHHVLCGVAQVGGTDPSAEQEMELAQSVTRLEQDLVWTEAH